MAGLSIDGQSESSLKNYCAHPENADGQAAWLSVDLGSVHRIINITLFNTINPGGEYIFCHMGICCYYLSL